MSTDGFALAATIIMLFPMLYFMIASLTFFLARLDDPIVTWLLRGLFNSYFLAVAACCFVAAVAFAAAGRLVVAVALCVVSAAAVAARRWFLDKVDTQLRAREAGDPRAVSRLRRLHLGGMLYNAAQLVTVVAAIPFVFVTAA